MNHSTEVPGGTPPLALAGRNNVFMQLCWVVPDIQAAMAAWTRTVGVGPFFFFERVTFENGLYRGKPAQFPSVTAAIAQAGPLQIELVCQNDSRPSIFREVVPAGQTGFHHAAIYCSDYDSDLRSYKDAGHDVAFSGLMMGSRTCWVDTRQSLGFLVELIEANPIAASVFAQFRAAAENWDGSNPVRTLG
jgi:hypothetical protein